MTDYITGDGMSICLKLEEGELGLILIGSKENPFYTPPILIWTEGTPPIQPGDIIDGYSIIIFLSIILFSGIISREKRIL